MYKKDSYDHTRIWQVAMIMKVRLDAMKKHQKRLYLNAKQLDERLELATRYYNFLKKRTESEKLEETIKPEKTEGDK